MGLKEIKQRGQIMVFCALIVPVLFCFVGAGIDLGWYYFNVSRLQNAADAAVLAGARALIDNDEKFSEYNRKAVRLVENTLGEEPDTELDTVAGDEIAAAYVLKNLSPNSENEPTKIGNKYIMVDEWGVGGNSELQMTPNIYQGGGGTRYYVIYLEEKVRHMFLPGWFDSVNAPVLAVAILTKTETTDDTETEIDTGSGTPLTLVFNANDGTFGSEETSTKSTETKSKKTTSTKTINSLEKITEDNETVTITADDGTPTRDGYEFLGWNTAADGSGTYIYEKKQLTPTEVAKLFGEGKSLTLYAVWKNVTKKVEEEVKNPINNITLWQQMEYVKAKNAYDPDWDVSNRKYGVTMNTVNVDQTANSNLEKFSLVGAVNANSGKAIASVERIFIDFKVQTITDTVTKTEHAIINVNTAYDVRSGKNDDPLYVRIESEPKRWNKTYWYGNKPQQIIININVSNLADNKRPLIFYYDGPEENREPYPVILNLNADFKGVLYMPDIPVVINGNGKGVGDGSGTNHKFEGFIIAKEYRVLDKTKSSSYTTRTHTTQPYTTTYKVDSLNNVQTVLIDGDYLKLRDKLETFYLSPNSTFRKFNIETDLAFTYIHYDANGDMVPLTDRDGKELIPLYDKNGTRITDWNKVKLYNKPAKDTTRKEYSKKDTAHARVPLLDSEGKPVPLYDEYGNKIYFCEDYGRLGIQYDILTLHRVDDKTRQPQEFLLTQPESNSDDWL